MKLKHYIEIIALTTILSIHFQQVNPLCNVYPKIFGDPTAHIYLNDMEIHEGTDTIVSGGSISYVISSRVYPILIVSSLSTTNVKWALTL
jgi:hypothetical protein